MFEDIDCNLYHNSLPSKFFFDTSEIEADDIDVETLNKFKHGVDLEAAINAQKQKEKDEKEQIAKESAVGPVSKIPGYSAVKYQKEAYGAYDDFYNPKSEEDYSKTYINGTLSCFCADEF